MFRPFHILLILLATALPAAAGMELSLYTGYQSAWHGDVTGTYPGPRGGDFDFNADWEGKPFALPPYYGVRLTRWRSARLGYGVEFNHAKAYASDAPRDANGFDRLEFTDGLNILTVNVFYRWPEPGERWTPYLGAGVVVAIPHVDVEVRGEKTFRYQLTGPAVQWVAGISHEMSESWAVFGEYKGSYSWHHADLDGGGTLKADILTNALNVGLSYRF